MFLLMVYMWIFWKNKNKTKCLTEPWVKNIYFSMTGDFTYVNKVANFYGLFCNKKQ